MADKARFYLEQSIPELQELEKKKVFTKVIPPPLLLLLLLQFVENPAR